MANGSSLPPSSPPHSLPPWADDDAAVRLELTTRHPRGAADDDAEAAARCGEAAASAGLRRRARERRARAAVRRALRRTIPTTRARMRTVESGVLCCCASTR
eukprot:1468553-Prymnesium_polylepis.1